MNDATTTQLVIERVFDAPRELVYRAFTDPDQLAQWFGPVGWSVPRDSVDLDVRVGGHQRFTMVNDADAAQTSPVDGTFTALVENELIEGAEDFLAAPDATEKTRMTMRIELRDTEDGRTHLVLTQGPFTAEVEGMAREGWISSFTKLDALLAA